MRFIFLSVFTLALYIALFPTAIFHKEKPLAVVKVTVTAYYTPLENQANYATGSREKDKKLNGNGITYSGKKAARGLIAADLRVFPLNTVLWVPQYGYARVADIGGSIKGPRLDLFMGNGEEALKEALRWGIRNTEVYVVKWGE